MRSSPYREYQLLRQVEDFDPDRTYDIEKDGELLDLLATKMLWDQKRDEEGEGTELVRDIVNFLNEVGEATAREISSGLSAPVEKVYPALRELEREDKAEVIGSVKASRSKAARVWIALIEVAPSGPAWLTPVQQANRYSHEIQVASGTPDPSVEEGIYKRPYRPERRAE